MQTFLSLFIAMLLLHLGLLVLELLFWDFIGIKTISGLHKKKIP